MKDKISSQDHLFEPTHMDLVLAEQIFKQGQDFGFWPPSLIRWLSKRRCRSTFTAYLMMKTLTEAENHQIS